MKCLVTGSAGFVGIKLVNSLREEGHEVVEYDIADGQDILDTEQLDAAVKDVDIVYHIAAQADLTKITDIEKGRECVKLNVDGTQNVAFACAKYNKWLIYSSTCCVYGNSEEPFGVDDEDHGMPHPREIYAACKLAGENIVIGYSQSFDLPYTILRYGTIYGPGMRGALAPAVFFKQSLAGNDITIHGDGKQERTQTYIDDLVDGSVAVIEHKEDALGHIINLCGTEKISVIKMAEDIKNLTESKSKIVHGPDRKWQTFYENVNLEKARRLLDWEPQTTWKEGIAKTYEWIKKNGVEVLDEA